MANDSRPLSPHLQVFRWHLLMTMSILHRMTGVFLSLGALLLVYWLVALAGGPQSYATAATLLTSWPGQLLLLAWSASLFYHLCNGIRHLFWDAGSGYSLGAAYLSGYAVLLATLILTACAWGAAWLITGGW